jgi:hypothetical protein
MSAHRRMFLIGAKPELTDAEHLALALEFLDEEVGREYLRDEDREDLLDEFERLSGEGESMEPLSCAGCGWDCA